jgi:hypothetical protein
MNGLEVKQGQRYVAEYGFHGIRVVHSVIARVILVFNRGELVNPLT